MKRFFPFLMVMVAAICLPQNLLAASPGIVLPEDPTNAYITLGILLVAAIMFFTEVVSLPITALLVPVCLSLTGVISSKVAFSYFGDPTVVLFMAMFIVGEGTFITGFADKAGQLAVALSRGNPVRLLFFAMLVVGLLSTVLSNTGTTVVAVPMILGMCLSARLAPGKILMPVAFASSLGGTVTLVGTPPNGIVNSMLEQMDVQPFGFFEFGLIGIPLLVVGLAYYTFVGHRFLPEGNRMNDDLLTEQRPRRTKKMWLSVGIFAFVVIMMASECIPLTTAAVLGACLMVITRCMTIREAFRSVDWTTIFLFAGMLSMSAAMSRSGAAAIVAHAVVSRVSEPWMLMLVCCALTALVTNFMSNTATAALMAPLALPIATASGVSPLPIVMGIAMSASACFLTPIATPPNTIVLGPGKYSFLDYVKIGWPLQLITLVMCWLLIPHIWPFHP